MGVRLPRQRGFSVADYRSYTVGSDGRFISFEANVCESDVEAVSWAEQLVKGVAMELWSGPRFVLRLEPIPKI